MIKIRKIIKLINFEWVRLKKDIQKEYEYVMSLSFKDYLFDLFFSARRGFFFNIFRIFLLIPFFRFLFDFFFFVFSILFNIYFIIFDKIFLIWDKILIILLEFGFFLNVFLKISNFFRYFFLFMFFVNINKDLQKKRIPLWLYIFEFFSDILIKIFRTQIKWRNVLYPVIKVFEIIIVFFNFIASGLVFFFNLLLVPIISFLFRHLFIKIWYKIYYYKGMFFFNNSGDFLYLNNVSLVQMSVMLQKNGFVAPVCNNYFRRFKAYFDYKRYRIKYILSELTPDYADSKTLDIYIFLYDLFKDTSHVRKNFGYFDIFRSTFPYNYIMCVYFFLIDFIRGVIYICYMLSLPIVFLIIFFLGLYLVYGRVYFYYCMCFKDFDMLIQIKIRNERVKKVKRYIKHIYIFFFNKLKFLWFFFFNPLKKVYEKIFW